MPCTRVYGRSKNSGYTLGPRPLGWGVTEPWKLALPHMCYQLHAKFDRSNSNVTTYERTRTEIREENGHLASHIFKVIQVHWNRLGSIGLISVDPKQSLGSKPECQRISTI